MNVYKLLEYKGVDIEEIHKFFCENRYDELYHNYTTVINDLLLLTSEDEFDDFMDQIGEVDEEAFLLALAYNKGLCSSFGMYEENAEDVLQQYRTEREKYIVLLDGTYGEGCYYIFELLDVEDDGMWESKSIERIL